MLSRYRNGESLASIARDHEGESEATLRNKLFAYCDLDEYKEAKLENAKARLSMRTNRHLHLESKADNIIEDKLDNINIDELEIDELKTLVQISKLMSDKANLAQGKATENINHSGSVQLSAPCFVIRDEPDAPT